MSRPVIPKEQLSAYQRWELDSFEEEKQQVNFPTAEEIERIHQSAQREGYEAGKAQGYKEGMAEASEKIRQMQNLLENFNSEMQKLDQEIAQDIVSLSLAIARQVLQQALEVKPELLLSIIRSAIDQVPPFNQEARLVLNPDDASFVRKELGEQLTQTGWKIFEDSRIEKGGCRVETTASQIDATLSNRWQRVVSAISQDSDWLVKD